MARILIYMTGVSQMIVIIMSCLHQFCPMLGTDALHRKVNICADALTDCCQLRREAV